MFAFAAADFERHQVLLARDRLGKKPLYYTVRMACSPGRASSSRSIARSARSRSICEALDSYLAWQYIPAPKTIYKEVRALPPGTLRRSTFAPAMSRNGATGICTSARIDRSASTSGASGSTRRIRDAVAVRFMSDVPFGAFLSGGIDSSLVVAYMAELMQEPVKTFTIGFHEAEWSEVRVRRAGGAHRKTDHHIEIVEPESLGLLPLLVRHYGQPFADSSAIPTYYVSRMAQPAREDGAERRRRRRELCRLQQLRVHHRTDAACAALPPARAASTSGSAIWPDRCIAACVAPASRMR